PRLDGPSRRLDLEVGATKRHLVCRLRHEKKMVAPPDAQVDGANRHGLPERSEGLAHVLRFCEDVEDESDGCFELSGDENLELVRELDDCRRMVFGCHCGSPCRCSSLRFSSTRSNRSFIARSYLANHSWKG